MLRLVVTARKDKQLALSVREDQANELRVLLAEAGVAVEGEATQPADGRPSRHLASVPPEYVLVLVGAATSATVHAAASVLREYIQSKKARVRVVSPEGSEIDIEGSLDEQQIISLIDASLAPPS